MHLAKLYLTFSPVFQIQNSLSLSRMEDIAAPSFSLGLDLDFESDPQTAPIEECSFKQSPQSSRTTSFQNVDEDDGFQPQTLYPEQRVDDPPPILKRLRRGPSVRRSVDTERDTVRFRSNIDDEIEEFSSQEDPHREEHSTMQNHSACSSSKFQLNGRRILATQPVNELKEQRRMQQTSNVSMSATLAASSNNLMFPELTISPVRKFQLIDSDSDDPTDDEYVKKDATRTSQSANKRQSIPGLAAKNELNNAKTSASVLQPVDLWKEFCPKKTVNIPTPALDEFCDEYFRTVNSKNLSQRHEDDLCVDNSRGSHKKSNISENVENYRQLINPPAHKYFFHRDPMIRDLVYSRLPYFSPLAAVNNQTSSKHDPAVIDYMSQFGQREESSRQGTRNAKLEGSLKRGRKNLKSSNAEQVSQASGNWINPKTCENLPKDAGKRRVHADGHGSGHWYTGQDGRKVYVTKSGQELTGQMAYRRYRKESRTSFKKSRKKTSGKKKTKK